MTTYTTRKTTTRKAVTPQPVSQPIAKREADMTVNHTAGYVFKLDEMKALERFLILGVTGPTYYVTKDQGMAEANAIITAALLANFYGAIDLACDISQDGRAAKNEQSIYVLARAIATGRADEAAYALARMDKVVRIGTHLHHLMQYLKDGQALSGSRGKLVRARIRQSVARQAGRAEVGLSSQQVPDARRLVMARHLTPRSPQATGRRVRIRLRSHVRQAR